MAAKFSRVISRRTVIEWNRLQGWSALDGRPQGPDRKNASCGISDLPLTHELICPVFVRVKLLESFICQRSLVKLNSVLNY